MALIAGLPVAGGILAASRHVHGFRYLSCPFFCVSFYFFSLALKRMDLSVAYAIRAGIGTVLIALIRTMCFREGVDTLKPISLAGLAKTIPNTLKWAELTEQDR